jgi:hypothetical protein
MVAWRTYEAKVKFQRLESGCRWKLGLQEKNTSWFTERVEHNFPATSKLGCGLEDRQTLVRCTADARDFSRLPNVHTLSETYTASGYWRLFHWRQSDDSVKLTMIAAISPFTHNPLRRVEEKIYFNSPHNKAGGNQRDVTHPCSGSYLDRISESGFACL